MKSRETSFSRQVFTTLQREAKIESTFMKHSTQAGIYLKEIAFKC